MITPYSHGQDYNGNTRNLIDYYKSWTNEEVRACLQKNRSDIVTVFENLSGDFNKASAIRASNAFLGKEVYIVGRRKYDNRGCVGTNHYENIYHADSMKEVIDYLKFLGYNIYAVDNILEKNPINLFDLKIPLKSAFIFGEENRGLTQETIEMCDDMVYIQQYGSVRSLNVSSAAAIIQFEYARQWRREN